MNDTCNCNCHDKSMVLTPEEMSDSLVRICSVEAISLAYEKLQFCQFCENFTWDKTIHDFYCTDKYCAVKPKNYCNGWIPRKVKEDEINE